MAPRNLRSLQSVKSASNLGQTIEVPSLRHATGSLDLSRPRIMGVVNASPESFSDSEALARADLTRRTEHALELVEQGADILDIGGQSARTDQKEISIDEELSRIVPLLEAIAARSAVALSIDAYRPAVISAALDAGASIINDVSGLADPAIAPLAVERQAALVVMHTRLAPKVRLKKEDLFYADPEEARADVLSFLGHRLTALVAEGLSPDQIILDPGPDFAKTPAQTVAVLQGLSELGALGAPLLLALSRKDFVGAATMQPPRSRLAGTLAAIGFCTALAPQSILRVHDVAATRDYLAVLEVLEGHRSLDWNEPLADELRYDRPSGSTP